MPMSQFHFLQYMHVTVNFKAMLPVRIDPNMHGLVYIIQQNKSHQFVCEYGQLCIGHVWQTAFSFHTGRSRMCIYLYY
jgi:hypothetical protein